MKRRFACAALVTLFAVSPAHAALEPGARAPAFSTAAALAGQELHFDLAQALTQGPVVLYFYPAAFTAGCTIEAHEFAEATELYAQLGARVVGVSADNIDVLKQFSQSACQGKFAVAADADGRIMHAYDAVHDRNPDVAQRISYVISPDGRIIDAYTDSNPHRHVEHTLRALRGWLRQ